MSEQSSQPKLQKIIGSRMMFGRYTIPAKCADCGKYIFLMDIQNPPIPIDASEHLCVECAIKDIKLAIVRGGKDDVKEMMLDGLETMQKAGI